MLITVLSFVLLCICAIEFIVICVLLRRMREAEKHRDSWKLAAEHAVHEARSW